MREPSKRGKGKIGPTVGVRDSWKDFNANQVKNSPLTVDYKTYRALIESFNKAMVDKILNESYEFKLPYRLGSLRIRKKKMSFKSKNALRVDYKRSRESGKLVYHMNDHRDNFNYRWYWKKKTAIVKNKTAYSFTPTRANKRELARLLLTDKSIDYFE